MTVRRLYALRADGAAGEAKIALIERALAQPPERRADVVRFHDSLLFLRAFPDSARVRRAAEAACAQFHRIAAKARRALDEAADTGIAGTTTRDVCVLPIAKWLHQRFANAVDIEWGEVEDESAIDALLRPMLQRAEEDAFDSGELSTREWIALRRGASGESDLGWLLRAAPRRARNRAVFTALYDAAAIPLRWRLGDSRGSTTNNVLRTKAAVYRRAMRAAPEHPVRFIASRTHDIELLSPRRADQVIQVARAALAARAREVHAISYANRSEVYLADLGEGVSLAVVGVVPAQRMSIEANYGYLMLSNGVPVGYGGVTPLYRQANTGLNIFPSFRGGEAAYLWAATLRAFHSLFGIRRFVVNGYQVGKGNREAIRSGAFWFYYRLGFRPADPATRRLARREFAAVRERGRRSTAHTLRALASGDLWLDLPGFKNSDYFDESWLVECSRRATEVLARESGVSPADAARAVGDRLARRLGCGNRRSWSKGEREAFENLAPVCALLPGIDRWSATAPASVVEVLRAKGLSGEREFVLKARRDRCFFPGLIRAMASRV